MTNLRLAVAAWLIAAAPSVAQDAPALPALFDVQGVAADDVLNLRGEPSAAAEALGSLAPDSRSVEVVILSDDGAWGLVGQGEGGGWAAMKYLARQPGQPPWWELRAPMTCMGTEPFWTVKLSTAMMTGDFITPEPPPLTLQAAAIWPGNDRERRAGVSLAGAGATVTLALSGELCSDGMSDRDYGITAMLLMSGGPLAPKAPLQGCCSMSAP